MTTPQQFLDQSLIHIHVHIYKLNNGKTNVANIILIIRGNISPLFGSTTNIRIQIQLGIFLPTVQNIGSMFKQTNLINDNFKRNHEETYTKRYRYNTMSKSNYTTIL